VYEELEEARKAHVVLLKREMEADPATSRLDRRFKVIYKRIGRRVDLCHKHVNWFLSKFKFVLFPSFRADEKLLSRTKNNPLPQVLQECIDSYGPWKTETGVVSFDDFEWWCVD
jgi:hypothetical protein